MPAARKRPPSRRRSATPRRPRAAAREAFVHLSSDWYWEQDAQLRFSRVELRHGDPAEQALARQLIGKARWETGIDIEGGWDAHRALLEAHEPFRDVLIWRTFEDGSRRYVSVSGEPMFDARGRFTGYRGVGRDITAQKRAERLLRLEHRVTRCLNEAASPAEALRAALHAICETEGWDHAELWSAAGAGAGDDARAAVLRSGEPLWVPAEATGRQAALLLPVRAAGRVTGVLEFTARRIRQPHKRLQQALHVIATMIGQYLQRAEAEQAVRDSEARFRSLTHLSSDWYWEMEAEHRFTRLEGRLVAGGDESLRRKLMGARRWDTGLEAEGGWDAHRADLEARRPFYDVLMWRSMPDGSSRYVSVSGEPVFDAEGRFVGYRGVGRDVTAQKRGEQILRLEHTVATRLSEAESAAQGLQAVMQATCETEGWACGRYFRWRDAAKALTLETHWSAGLPGLDRFIAASRKLSYSPGDGLVGMVYSENQPLWIRDLENDPRTKAKLGLSVGMRGAFLFPALSEGRPIGVFVFHSREVREPDPRLVQASRVIGSQVGQFLQRKQAEESLRESEARFRSLTQMSSDFFWETDAAHRLCELVHGPSYPVAYMGRGVLGKAAWEIPSESPDEAGWAAHRAALEQHLPFRDFEFARLVPEGGIKHFAVSGEPHFAVDGSFLGYRGVGRDITEIALARERIASLAYSDPLTGLANRASLGPSLEQAVQRARRKNAKLAVVFLDLDGFKEINDAFGHDAGDALLVEVGRRLRAHLRAGDLVVRFGGDEFLVVLEELQDLAPIEAVSRKLLAAMTQPYRLAGGEARVTASIGISVYPDDAADGAALMKHADTAMYAAKQSGKNTFRFYASGPAANDAGERGAASGDAAPRA
jgi:diguanylate cyclase (GGDEF)-like protein/PAS domain S-box-containing protein